MVGGAFLSAKVVTREFGLIGELFHMVFQSAISEMFVEKADHHCKTFWQCGQIRQQRNVRAGKGVSTI